VSKAVLDSSVIIALSMVGYLNKLKPLFQEILVAKAVYDEICEKGHGLIGDRELQEAVKSKIIEVKEVKNRLLVNALLDPLAIGEAETITLAAEERADQIVLDDKAARRRAKAMKLNVIGTLRILRMMYDAKLIDKHEIIEAIKKLREMGFKISEDVINKTIKELIPEQPTKR
jgi:predicted nucleic acid-binding protein